MSNQLIRPAVSVLVVLLLTFLLGASYLPPSLAQEGERRQTAVSAPSTYTLQTDLPAMANWMVLGEQADANFGTAVAYVGDLDGDGFADAVVGANLFSSDFSNQGEVSVYFGTAAGLSDFAEIALTLPEPNAQYGHAVAAAGDINADGYADMLTAAPYAGPEAEGKVFVDYGDAEGLLLGPVLMGQMPNSRFGFAVAAGDINGNSYTDVVVGAPGHQGDGVFDSGAVFLFYGGPTGISTEPDWMVESYEAGAQVGYALAVGDFNNDGYADIAIGAKTYDGNFTDAGAVFVFYGSAQGPAGGSFATLDNADWAYYGESNGHYFGAALAAGGDVIGNGADDLIVGAPGFGFSVDQYGAVYGFWGSATGLGTGSYNWFTSDYQVDSEMGTAVAIIPDITGNGYDEVLVGAPNGYPGISLPVALAGGGQPGIVSLYLGGPFGLGSYRDMYLTSGQPGSRFGQALAASSSGVLVGAPQYVADGEALGAVFGFAFSPISGLTAVNSSPTPLGEPTSFAAMLLDGGPAQFEWDFGDGNFGTGQFVEHTYDQPGLYTAVVTAISPFGTLMAETAVTINVTGDINPETGGTLDFISSMGWGINVTVPPNAVDRRIGLSFVPLDPNEIEEPLPPNASTYFFDIDPILDYSIYLPYISNGDDVYSGSQLHSGSTTTIRSMAISQDRFDFLLPITVSVTYTDDQIPGLDEEELILVYWDAATGTWLDAATTCDDPAPYVRDPDNNQITLQICHLSRFSMVGD